MPSSVVVATQRYSVKTWFKDWLRFFELMEENQDTVDYKIFDYLYTDKIPENKEEGFRQLCLFCSPPQILPRNFGNESNTKLIDYSLDADYIYCAFMEQYGLDLVEGLDQQGKPLHWYKFKALLHGLHDTRFSDIIQIRSYEDKGQGGSREWKMEQERLKRMWEIPSKEGAEDDKQLQEFLSLFNC